MNPAYRTMVNNRKLKDDPEVQRLVLVGNSTGLEMYVKPRGGNAAALMTGTPRPTPLKKKRTTKKRSAPKLAETKVEGAQDVN